MGIAEDIQEATDRAVKQAQETTVWPATITSLVPLTVCLDGSGISVPCSAINSVTLAVARRCVVQRVGKDLVIVGSFGTVALTDLTLSGDLFVGDDVTITGDIFWGLSTSVESSLAGPISHLNATFVYAGLAQAFVAPPSGKVTISWAGAMKTVVLNSFIYIGYELRDGAAIGSGSVISGHSAAISRSVKNRGFANQEAAAGRTKLATGLTPNADYHVRLMHASSDTTGVNESSDMDLSITPEL